MHDAEFTNEAGKRQKYYMGCYGIGIGRTLAAIVEAYNDERGIRWPENIAPYKVCIVRLGEKQETIEQADKLYNELQQRGITVIYDDRNLRAGEKFADADLIGIPHRIVVSDKLSGLQQYEYKLRTSSEVVLYKLNEVIAKVA